MPRKFNSPPVVAAIALERLPRVKERTCLSRSEIYRRIATGDFPTPVKLGERASAWAAHEVSAWIAARIVARNEAHSE
ncbi:helix-turn-helix transcriptional regulator [Noviluteimonas gilva]|uniref:AlpA family phage regulatory protein n=1 Tax=Noviluteimonas gilva TaxID=2682097 RepID=A0A7C9M1T4_9GAMM|nr:AlpA family phage regulatory protein [Lysobacter gilvus]MUV14588.1 AlpA family phage regulatory protein [Lysobacter gilvus]